MSPLLRLIGMVGGVGELGVGMLRMWRVARSKHRNVEPKVCREKKKGALQVLIAAVCMRPKKKLAQMRLGPHTRCT